MSPELSEDETRPALPSRQPVTSLEPAASVAQRLGRSVRTIERGSKAKILPPLACGKTGLMRRLS